MKATLVCVCVCTWHTAHSCRWYGSQIVMTTPLHRVQQHAMPCCVSRMRKCLPPLSLLSGDLFGVNVCALRVIGFDRDCLCAHLLYVYYV